MIFKVLEPVYLRGALTRTILLAGVLMLPAGLLWQPDLAEEILTLLALLGMVLVLRGDVAGDELSRIRLLSLLLLGFFLSCALSVGAAQDDFAGFDRLKKYQHFLLAPFVALALLKSAISPRLMLAAAKLGALVVGLLALSQYAQTAGRAGGVVNALVFGCLAQLLGFFSLLRYPLEKRSARLISLAAFSAGGVAALLSQSRGTWIAAPLLLIMTFLLWKRAALLSKRTVLEVGGCFLLLVLLAASIPFVQQRVGDAMQHYSEFTQSRQWSSSVGQRLMMWESALVAGGEQMLLGWGPHRTQLAAAAKLDEPRQQQIVLQYNHLHNEYINVLVGQGVVGLVGLLLLLFVPLLLCLKHAGNPGQLVTAGFGALLCTGYALQGLSNLAFGHDIMNVFFVFFMSFALPAVVSQAVVSGRAGAGRLVDNKQLARENACINRY